MSIAEEMLLVAAILPYLTVGAAKAQFSYNNAAPRAWLDKLGGWRARAEWAHRNHFEAFPAFAAAVIIAEYRQAPQHHIDLLAVVFVLLRVCYTACYVANLASLRSVFWAAGFACVVALFVSA